MAFSLLNYIFVIVMTSLAAYKLFILGFSVTFFLTNIWFVYGLLAIMLKVC